MKEWTERDSPPLLSISMPSKHHSFNLNIDSASSGNCRRLRQCVPGPPPVLRWNGHCACHGTSDAGLDCFTLVKMKGPKFTVALCGSLE